MNESTSFEKFVKYWTEDKALLFHLISISILLFAVYPFAGDSEGSVLMTNILLTIMLLTGVASVNVSKKTKLILIGIILLVLIVGMFGKKYENNFITNIHVIARLVFMWMLVILIFIKVFGGKPLTFFFRITGSITIYLLLGFIWANIYFIIYIFDPKAFNFQNSIDTHHNIMFNFIYFSFEVLTTLGLGDIIPLHHFAKSMVILEAVAGPLYLAVTIGRLVSKRRQIGSED